MDMRCNGGGGQRAVGSGAIEMVLFSCDDRKVPGKKCG